MFFDCEYVPETLDTLIGRFRFSVWVTEDIFLTKGVKLLHKFGEKD